MKGFDQDEIRFIKEHGIFLGLRDTGGGKPSPDLAGYDRLYGIIGLDRRNASRAAALAGTALKNGYTRLRFELCGKGRWTARELDGLRAGLAGLGQLLLKSVIAKKPFILLNLEDLLDPEEGCRIFSDMLMADAKGNYVLVPPQWRYDGRGVKVGHADTGIKEYQGCVHDAKSARCVECEKKNFALLAKIYDGNATAGFRAGIGKIFESVRYLAGAKPAFKAYLAALREDRDLESGLFINEAGKKAEKTKRAKTAARAKTR
ncbi:MAG TPA: hypothetical protein PKK31_08310 [Elusimicrobiales bacterium]|nr:hypothetical protein [Elusimicrobiales bacterium]